MNRNHFFRLSGKAIYLVLFLFSLTSQLYGAKKIETNLILYFSTYYNNNIIKLSPEDIDEFKQNLYSDRYKIKSVDDIGSAPINRRVALWRIHFCTKNRNLALFWGKKKIS